LFLIELPPLLRVVADLEGEEVSLGGYELLSKVPLGLTCKEVEDLAIHLLLGVQ
jgi:hypothetical protein